MRKQVQHLSCTNEAAAKANEAALKHEREMHENEKQILAKEHNVELESLKLGNKTLGDQLR